jgi:fructosamine-3-kinase
VTRAALDTALAASLGAEVVRREPIAGGDINQAFRVSLSDGRAVFVKTRAEPVPGMYAREAEGLGYLAEARSLRVPEVLRVDEQFLALEWITAGARGARFDELLGRGLAALHKFGARSFGLARDNCIGPLPQSNREHESWPAFYGQERLLALGTRAREQGALSGALYARLTRLCARLPALCGDPEPPSRLHGDLWSGNVMADARGVPVLIDPAVYGGDREVDLAMLQLFGSPSARFFAAYDETYPRKPGSDERVALYQLYPLLVHVCLFGAGYLGQLERALARYE